MSKRQKMRVNLFDEVITTFERIEESLNVLRCRWIATDDAADNNYSEDEQDFNNNPIVINCIWRLCFDIMRAVEVYANTQSSMKNDVAIMAKVNKRLDETCDQVKSNWLDLMSFGGEISFQVTSSSRERVEKIANAYKPSEPVHDQPWNLSHLIRIVMERSAGRSVNIYDWRRCDRYL